MIGLVTGKIKLILIGIVAAVSVGVLAGAYWLGYSARADKAIIEKHEAILEKSRVERKLQEKVNEITTKHQLELQNITNRHNALVDSLQQRTSRRDAESPHSSCQGATGRELYREDGEFLAREAARAEECRVTLQKYYEYVDIVRSRINEVR